MRSYLKIAVALTWAASMISVSKPFSSHARRVVNQSPYSLFHPAPRDQMRKLSPDRPTKTESPFTADAGHFMLETDLISYAKDEPSPGEFKHRTDLNHFNFKAGLSSNLDAEIILETYVFTEDHSGIGDLSFRAKYNLIGNDGGDFGVALLPYVKIPSSSGAVDPKYFSGGLIVPLEFSLPHEIELGFTAEVARQAEDEGGLNNELVFTTDLAMPIIKHMNGAIELYSSFFNSNEESTILTFDAYLIYELNSDLIADVGVNLGLTHAAEDFNPSLGFTYRY